MSHLISVMNAVRICFKVPELHGSVWVKVENASPLNRLKLTEGGHKKLVVLIYLAW